jgi:hypothetical protein
MRFLLLEKLTSQYICWTLTSNRVNEGKKIRLILTDQKYQANIDESPVIKYDARLVALFAPSQLYVTLHGLYSVLVFLNNLWGLGTG